MRLYLVRHPPPIIAPGLCYGALDVAASDVVSVAKRLQSLLPAGLPLWSSPLLRCRQLAELLHPAPQIDPRLQEMHFGDWEGKAWDAIERSLLDAWAADVAGFVPPGGESAWQLQARVVDFVRALDQQEAVLVTHAGVIRVLLAYGLDMPPSAWSRLVFDYGGLTVCDISPDSFRLLKLNV